MKSAHKLWLSVIFILVAGCASYPINPSIDQVNESKGYRFANLGLGKKNTDELFVVVVRLLLDSIGPIRPVRYARRRDGG